jgi:uncharacterized SAM-binding protein YcdF (DUF218 family)
MTVSYALSDLLLPPTLLVVTTLAGALLATRRRGAGIAIVALSQLALLAFSMPVVAYALARTLEPPPCASSELAKAQAIVILGGGRNRGAPEWGGETVKTYTLQRLRYGAKLARDTGLPIYVSGGKPDGGTLTEGALMRDVLKNDYGLAARWVDETAATTGDNAVVAARDLKTAGLRRVALITDGMHMPRAREVFTAMGLVVLPCPTAYAGQRAFAPWQLVPGATALQVSQLALREWVARGWYRLRYRFF